MISVVWAVRPVTDTRASTASPTRTPRDNAKPGGTIASGVVPGASALMGRCASLITMTPSGRVRAYPLTSMSVVVVIGGCLFLW